MPCCWVQWMNQKSQQTALLVVSQCPSSSSAYCLFATQGRPRTGRFSEGSAACGPSCDTARQTGTLLWCLGSKHHHQTFRQCLGFTLPGFRIQSAETAALRPRALSGTTRGTGLSRGLLMSYMS